RRSAGRNRVREHPTRRVAPPRSATRQRARSILRGAVAPGPALRAPGTLRPEFALAGPAPTRRGDSVSTTFDRGEARRGTVPGARLLARIATLPHRGVGREHHPEARD